jgi:hypothetical protein
VATNHGPAEAHELTSPAEPTPGEGDDQMLGQIARLWPALHPQARRAVVLYTSALWAELGQAK